MEVVIKNNKVEVSLDKIIEEGIKYLKSQTGVTISNYEVKDDKIELALHGNDENIMILKDRLGVEDSHNALINSKMNMFKSKLDEILKNDFSNYNIRFKSMDNMGSIIFVYLNVEIPTIPYPMSVNFKVYDEGFIEMGYMLFGDTDLDERWSSTSASSDKLIKTLKDIEAYYLSKRELPE